jgi:ankyrin repeat protein
MDLPLDEWTQVVSFLDYRSLARLSQCSHGFHRLVEDFLDPCIDNDMPIIVSASRGYTEAVRKLLADQRVDPHARKDLALVGAVINNHPDTLDLLLSLDYTTATLSEMLVDAVKRGHTRVVERLLQDKRCNPSYNDYQALYHASYGSDDIFSLLVPHGYTTSSLDREISVTKVEMLPTPPVAFLDKAVWRGDVELVSYLIQYADFDQRRKALLEACRFGHLPLVEILHRSEEPGGSYLLAEACQGGHENVANYLLDYYQPDYDCLRAAVKRGLTSIVKRSLPSVDPKGLLTAAARRGHSDIVDLLIPLTDLDSHGYDALIQACLLGQTAIVDRLLPSVKPTEACLEIAAKHGHNRIFYLLLPYLEPPFPGALYLAAVNGHVKLVKELLKTTYPIDEILHSACPHHEVVRVLLPQTTPNIDMFLTACSRYPKTLSLLLRDGRVDPRHPEVFFKAISRPDTTKLLLQDGRADPAALNNLAIRSSNNEEVVELLLKDPRVDPSANDNEAIRVSKCPEVVRLLLADPRVDPTANDNEAIANAATILDSSIRLLLADPRVDVTANGYRAIHNAVNAGRIDNAIRLVRHCRLAPSHLLAIGGATFCAKYAIRVRDLNLLQWAVAMGATITPDMVSSACKKGDLPSVTYLLTLSPPSWNTLFYARKHHSIIRLLVQDGRVDGHWAHAIDSCLEHGDIDLLKDIIRKGECYGRSYDIYRYAIANRRIDLLDMIIDETDPAIFGEKLLELGDEEMNKYLLRYPTMEPFRLARLNASR